MDQQTGRPRKTDRRTLYTRMVIKEAYMALLHKKEPARITVTDLCKAAEINRSTFYLHYMDSQAVLEELLDELLEKMLQMMTASVPEQTSIDQLFRLSGESTYRQILQDERCAFLLKKGIAYPPFVEKFAATFAEFCLPYFHACSPLPKADLRLVLTGLFYSYMMLDSYYLKKHSIKELEHCNALFNRYIFDPCQKELLSGVSLDGYPETGKNL